MTEINRMNKDFASEERARLMEQFHKSGLEYGEFAREHNINEKTFKNWLWIEARPKKPHKVYSASERKKVVESFQASGMTAKDFAKSWGVCQGSLCKWRQMYEEFGSDGLMNKARRLDDKRLGTKIPEAVQDEIIKLKKREPQYGIKKIRNWLYRFRGMKVSAGSIRKKVVSEGLPLAKKKKKKKKSSDRVRRFERAKPMQLWQSDITQFTLGQYWSRVYLTVFMDDHSRYIVGWRLQSRQTAELVIDAFKDAVMRFGKPEEVLTDQGRQYFAWRGKSELEKLLEKECIKHVVSRAHHPQTLGKCERFWETVGNEFWRRVKPQTLEEAKVRLKYFIDHYNHQRPHQGLEGQVPADRFFGVAEEVRAAIEKSVAQNAIEMACGELPKPPAFLIGQVGDQRISFHGTSGRFFLTHENLDGELNDKSNRSETSGETSGSSNEGSGGETSAEAKITSNSEVSSDTGEGTLAESFERGAEQSANESASDYGLLDGEINETGGGFKFEFETDQVLAAEQPSGGGDDSRAANPATHEGSKTHVEH